MSLFSENITYRGNSYCMYYSPSINPLKAQLNPICQMLALIGAHHIFHVGGLRVKNVLILPKFFNNGFHVTPMTNNRYFTLSIIDSHFKRRRSAFLSFRI